MGEISRRSLLKTSAWAAPAVAVVAAMPLAAASTAQYGIYQSYVGWVDVLNTFVFEAYVVKDGVLTPDELVTFTLLPSGVSVQAVSSNMNGYARAELSADLVPENTLACLIAVGDYQVEVPVHVLPPA